MNLAQMVEQWSIKPFVDGSIPSIQFQAKVSVTNNLKWSYLSVIWWPDEYRKENWWNEKSKQLIEARKLRTPQEVKVEMSNL